MVLFVRNNRFNVTLFLADYQLRWWKLPIVERACCKTHLGGVDYSLRISEVPPLRSQFILTQDTFHGKFIHNSGYLSWFAYSILRKPIMVSLFITQDTIHGQFIHNSGYHSRLVYSLLRISFVVSLFITQDTFHGQFIHKSGYHSLLVYS